MERNSQQSPAERGTVLVVDDSPAMQRYMMSLLGKVGYAPHGARTGAEACRLARELRPHVVLLDVMLPDMSGYDVCRVLKENRETRDIPVVFVSALTEVDEWVKGLRLGALDFVSKPINSRLLLVKVATFVRLCRDDRLLKAVHAELEASSARLRQFRQALDNASDAVAITDTQGGVTYCNRLFEALAQPEQGTADGTSVFGLFPEPAPLEEAFSGALAGTPSRIDTHLEQDGRKMPVVVRCSSIPAEDGSPGGLMFLIADQSERKRLEMELYHSQKLEAVGQLASGIAHEINTPIQFVGDNIRFVQDALEDLLDVQQVQAKLLDAAKASGVEPALTDAVGQALEAADLDYLREELPAALSQSLEGIQRVASIVQAMKEFAHPGTAEKMPANLQDAIRTTLTVARNKWKYVAELETDFDESLPPVPCLVDEFNQVVLNLVVNASDAIGDAVEGTGTKGTIRISAHLAGTHAEVRVADSGGGIPEDIQDRIFDPFFTTKEVGKGSGQGLAIAREVIVNKHGGEFFFETEQGQGTTFTIRLPLEPLNS